MKTALPLKFLEEENKILLINIVVIVYYFLNVKWRWGRGLHSKTILPEL